MNSSELKILQVAPCIEPQFGGSATVVRAYTEGLLKLGNNVAILSTINNETMREGKYNQQELFRGKYENFQLKQLQRCWPKSWFNAKNLTSDIKHYVNEVDIVHLHMLWDRPVLIGANISRRMKKPYFISPHGSLEPWRFKHKFIKKFLYMKIYGQNIMRYARCLHAVTEMEAENFRKAGFKGDIAIVPIGIEPSQFQDLPAPAEAENRWPILKNRRVEPQGSTISISP